MTRNSRSLLTFRAYEPGEKNSKYFSELWLLFWLHVQKLKYLITNKNVYRAMKKRECGLNLPYLHVVFDVVNPSLELSLGSIHIWDHGSNISYNGGKDQDAN